MDATARERILQRGNVREARNFAGADANGVPPMRFTPGLARRVRSRVLVARPLGAAHSRL